MQWFWVPSVHHNYLGNMWVPEKHKKLSSGVIREPDGALPAAALEIAGGALPSPGLCKQAGRPQQMKS